jgi:hypothetical protein
MPTLRRKIVAYQIDMNVIENEQVAIERWLPEIFVNSLTNIITKPEHERVEETKDWFFYLDNVKLTDDGKLIYGYFKSARIGSRLPLIRRSTFHERENPKYEDEGEKLTSYFAVRLSDGLFLLEKYFQNVITAHRIDNYLESQNKEYLRSNSVQNIIISPLLDPDFLRQLANFKTLSMASIKVAVERDRYGQNDAVKFLQETAVPIRANYATLQLGVRQKKKFSLSREKLIDFIRNILADREQILAVKIEGIREGEESKIDLKGIEEKYYVRVGTNDWGEVLPEDILNHIIELGRRRPRIR